MQSAIIIPKRLTHGEELLVVRRVEYEQLRKRLAEVKDALMKIRQGKRELRVLFRFLNKNEVVYYDIGTHDIYQ